MMYPSNSYEAQLPTTMPGGVTPMIGGSFQGSFQGPGVGQGPGPGAHSFQGPRPQSPYAANAGYQSSAPTYMGPGPEGTRAAPECEQECAEEECDPDQCGDEHRGPDAENTYFGFDVRPFLPLALTVTTFLGAVGMLTCQLPLVNGMIGNMEFVLGMLIAFFGILYLVTLTCIIYCSLSDPGQIKQNAYAAMEEIHLRQGEQSQQPLPKRAQKTWLYRLPVRRYDHYCRWVTNCIGLLNHREFITMCTGLVVISVSGIVFDLIALIPAISKGSWLQRIVVSFHLFYSFVLLTLVGPILRIHLGLVSRNELASEWKRNDFYVVRNKGGEKVPVNDLSDDEFNNRFDSFEYDPRKNVFDHGCVNNWWSFCCIPRWSRNQMGEF